MNPSSSSSVFGLIAELERTRVRLPLIHIETRFRVTGAVAAVEIDQVFEQNARQPLDVTYTFPLPGRAAVHRCEMIVNGRVIRAVVMAEAEARRTAAEKKAAGHRTALVEMDRENLFTLQLGNTNPGDHIIIRFAYIERLDRLGAQLSLRIPFSPGVRYIPGRPLLRGNRGLGYADDTDQAPDASRLTPPRIHRTHPDAATLHLHGRFDAAEVAITSLSSPSHPAVLHREDTAITAELAGEDHIPDCDFILRWEETATAEPKACSWSTLHGGHAYALLQIRAPGESAATSASESAFEQDIYFLLDRSGSMDGLKWQKCAQALHAFVRQLGPRDRVWITCFESDYQDFAESLLPRDDLLADPAFQRLAEIGTAGGTELLSALEHVLSVRHRLGSARPARFILITDGQVGNEAEILRLMHPRETGPLPIHTFGIDTAVNDAFLKSLAGQTGGRCTLMAPHDDIPGAVARLAATLRRPVLTHLTLPPHIHTPADLTTLPDLHAGETALVPIRCAPGLTKIEITAALPGGAAWRQAFTLAPEPSEPAPAARLLWVHRRCRHLIATHRRQEAVELAIQHNLLCDGASFIAWDETEKVPVARQEIYQPSGGLEFCRTDIPKKTRSLSSRPSGGRAALMSDSPAAETNFFEGRVSDYLAASTLQECSDEALTEPLPPPSAEEVHLRQMRALARPYADKLSPAARAQVDSVRDQLRALGLTEEIATFIAVILLAWSHHTIGGNRQAHLTAFLATLTPGADPLPPLRQFTTTHLTASWRRDLQKLLHLLEPAAKA